jgi:hypothetical protein
MIRLASPKGLRMPKGIEEALAFLPGGPALVAWLFSTDEIRVFL